MRQVPYNTGKVKIGCQYEPRRNYMDADSYFMQSVLLGDYNYRRRQMARRVLYVVGLVALFVVVRVLT